MAATTGATHSSAYLRKITASGTPLNPRPVSIYVAADGTMDIENDDSTNSTEAAIPVLAGTTINCQFYKITAISGGASIYGYFNAEA